MPTEFFYCYSMQLHKYLHKEKGLKYYATGLHPRTYKPFWQYKINDEFIEAYKEYEQLREKMKKIV